MLSGDLLESLVLLWNLQIAHKGLSLNSACVSLIAILRDILANVI